MDKGYTGKRKGDVSIGILLAFQAFEPEFGPRTHVKKPHILVCTYNPRPRKVETGKPLGLTGQKSSLLGKFQAICPMFLK